MATTSIAPARIRRAPATPYSFVCGDKTVTWEASWYTEPFYTSNTVFWDARAAVGPINPPWEVWGTISACQPPPTATWTPTLASPSPALPDATATPTPAPVPTSTSEVTSSTPASSSLVSSLAPSTSSASTASSTSTATQLQSTTTMITAESASTLSSTSAASASFEFLSSSASPTPSATTTPLPTVPLLAYPTGSVSPAANFHAGTWDSQAQGVAFVAVLALTLGALVWGLWMFARGPFAVFYSPRSWFVPPASRPPEPTAASIFTPWRHLPSLASPTGEAVVATHVQAAVLGVTTIGAVLGLTVFLPLMIAGVPHLSDTAPPNSLGGRLGTLTDLSILRLLNARDPTPNTRSAGATRDVIRRALSSTVAPLASAKGRLIALVILSGVVWVGASLYIIRRTYNKLFKYSAEFVDACAGQEMVFIPSQEGWAGKSEAEIKRTLSDLCKTEGESIAGVFSVGHMLTIRALIDERTHVHDVLETAEAKYLESLIPASTNITTHTTNETVSSLGFNTGSSRNSASDMDALNTDFSPAVPQGSAFLEVQQRSSVIRHKGKLMIGQKIIRDEDGTFIPAPDDEDPFCDRCAEGGMDAIKEERSPTPEGSSAYLRPSPTKERPISQDSAFSTVDKVRYSQLSVRPVSQLDDAELDRLRADIAWSRARLTKLNAQTDRAQNLALTALTSGSATVDTARVGCIIVGRGVRSLPHAVDIEGRSKEDIMWDNLGEPSGVTMFWVKVVGVTLLAAAFCLPFLGLAVASAPGVSSRLTFLEPLSKSNGLGSGIAEGLIAALSITLALVGGVKLIELFAEQARPISFMTMQSLAVKGSFYFLLFTGTILFLLIGALVFAVPWFHAGVQKARGMGDGAAYITFLALVLVINVCILIPGLLILQPGRFVRWYLAKQEANTPRKRFQVNRPPTFNPTAAIAPVLSGFFFLSALGGLLPLLVIPILILSYLALVSGCWLATRVFCISRGGPSNGGLGLWIVRRLGWAVVLQPAVLGLVLLSRRQWVGGALGLVFAAVGLLVSEVITFGLHRKRPESEFLESALLSDNRNSSQHSLLVTLYTLLPGLSRLPDGNPLPLPTDAIDDMRSTERAAYATPNAGIMNPFEAASETPVIVMGPTDDTRGLIYPPELLLPAPNIWLPRDPHGFAKREVESLASDGLEGFVDPENKP